MTREQASELLPLIKAYVEGETIQILCQDKVWRDCELPTFFVTNTYRIKPKSREIFVVELSNGSLGSFFYLERPPNDPDAIHNFKIVKFIEVT